MAETSLVQMKGLRDGLLVSLGDAAWPVLESALMNYIEKNEAFFKGARVALEVGNQILKVAELSALRDTLSGRGIILWAVIGDSPTTESASQLLGLATRLHKPRPTPEPNPPARGIDNESALWIHKTLRSGVRVEYAGHVVIVGDVNPGAEVIAGGSVLIWGRLRGVVHAGAEGNQNAVVCALDLAPTQLRIAGQIATSPRREGSPQPEMIKLKDGRLQAESWHPG